ncbi:HalOD1 output domain-containing protein [Halostella pelagica]|uniref:HalOD1 output domain-containing protein n=1 Tax=Halostella pelagica TaxID=2583824 RepID=UPI00192A3F85|nr:HalOD1 output domain-containing protein [Halostella pelagica]
MSSHSTAMERDESVALEIIREIAERERCEYTDLPPLYEAVDLEAATDLLESNDVRIEFDYCGYGIVLENREFTLKG